MTCKTPRSQGMCTEDLFPVSCSIKGEKHLIKSTESRLQISRRKCLSTCGMVKTQIFMTDGGVVARELYMGLEKGTSEHMKEKSGKGFQIQRCSFGSTVLQGHFSMCLTCSSMCS